MVTSPSSQYLFESGRLGSVSHNAETHTKRDRENQVSIYPFVLDEISVLIGLTFLCSAEGGDRGRQMKSSFPKRDSIL
jgi:hypothetical protein